MHVELRSGWPLILGAWLAFLTGAVAIPFYIIGPMTSALQNEFGWTRGAVQTAATFHSLGLAISTPFIGRLSGFISLRTLAVGSSVVGVLAMASLSLLSSEIGHLYIAHLVMAAVGGCGVVALTRVVGANFVARRGYALGIVLTGWGVAGFVTPYLVAGALVHASWREAYLFAAALMALGVPVTAFLFRTAELPAATSPLAAAGPEPLHSAERSPPLRSAFVLLVLVFAMIWLVTPGLILQFMPMLLDGGMTATRAAQITSLLGVAGIMGRVATGWLVDRTSAHMVGFAIFALAALGCTTYLWIGPGAVLVLVLAIGIMNGAEIDLMSYMVLERVGVAGYAKAYGLLFGICSAAGMASPLLFGWLFEIGGYPAVFLGGSAGLAIAAGLLLVIGRAGKIAQPAAGLQAAR